MVKMEFKTGDDTISQVTGEMPTVEQVISHIDAEISELRTSQGLNGWNTWALLSVFTVLIPALVLVWGTMPMDLTKVAFWILCFSLLADSILPWIIVSGNSVSKPIEEQRLRPIEFIHGRRVVFVAALTRYVLLVILAGWFAFHPILMAAGMFVPIPIALYGLKILQMVFWIFPLRDGDRVLDIAGTGYGARIINGFGERHYIGAWGLTVMAIVSALIYASAASIPAFGQPIPSELQLGFILVTLALLILWIIDLIHRPSITRELLKLRRQVVARNITPKVALEQVEVIVDGTPLGVSERDVWIAVAQARAAEKERRRRAATQK